MTVSPRSRAGARSRSEAGAGAVALLVLISVALAVFAGAVRISRSLGDTLTDQSVAVRSLGDSALSQDRAPALPRGPGPEPSLGRPAPSTGVADLGVAFGAAAGATVYAGLREMSDLVNPFSDGFLGRRMNRAALALGNLVMNPEQQLAREAAALEDMWSGVEGLASHVGETVARGDGPARAELAGLMAGMLINPLPNKLAGPMAAGRVLARSSRDRQGGLSPGRLSDQNSQDLEKALVASQGKENLWRDVPARAGPDRVHVIVEVPKGSRQKHELDIESGDVELDRTLPEGFGYPVHYGLIPRTFYHDGDPIDVLLVGGQAETGSVVKTRVVGVLEMADEKGPDAKVVVVPESSGIRGIEDLDPQTRSRIEQFFATYKDHEPGKSVQINGWHGRDVATQEVDEAIRFFDEAVERVDASPLSQSKATGALAASRTLASRALDGARAAFGLGASRSRGAAELVDGNGVPETRTGEIPEGTAPMGQVPPGGLFDFSVSQNALNIHAVARDPNTPGRMSDLLAQRVRGQPGSGDIQRVNVYDIVNPPTLDALRRGVPFLEAPGVGRMTARTMERLGLKPGRVELSSHMGKLSAFIQLRSE